MPETPDRFFIDKKDRKQRYEKLKAEDLFQNQTNRDLFLLAMAIGVLNRVREPIGSKDGFFLEKDMRPEDYALIDAVAVYEKKSVEILANRSEVFKIAEEYAHGGVRILADQVQSTPHGSYDKFLERQLHELRKRVGLD